MFMYRAAERGPGEGANYPGPQTPRDLITPNASRSGVPHKVNQQ